MAEQSYGDWIRSNPPLPTKRYKKEHMAQQTAIGDLIIALVEFADLDGVDHDTIIAAIELAENRKEMEEEQIKGAYKADRYPCSYEDAEEYYNKTYKQNT